MTKAKSRAKARKAKARTIQELEGDYLHARGNLVSTLTEGDMWISSPDDLPSDPDELHDALDEIEQHGWNHVSDAKDCREALNALIEAKGGKEAA